MFNGPCLFVYGLQNHENVNIHENVYIFGLYIKLACDGRRSDH